MLLILTAGLTVTNFIPIDKREKVHVNRTDFEHRFLLYYRVA